ncbi:MAG: M20/M25/M40 family metallo-hydrolase [Acidimicrobiia bacterium]
MATGRLRVTGETPPATSFRPWFETSTLLLILAASVWLTVDQTLPPAPSPADAPVDEFSAQRAMAHLEVIAAEPRLVGSPAFEEARDYVMTELASLGLTVEVQRTRLGFPVENVVARIDGTSSSDALLLVAHLDSVSAAPGAMDDGSGVVVLLETARALREGPPLSNSVIFLFTGPEETGGHGARAFITEHLWVDDVKVVANFDAGGMGGPVELTSTSLDNGWLISQLAKADQTAYGNSGSGEGSSDFTIVFEPAGFSGYAFDNSWDRRTHSPFDTFENARADTIQQAGNQALSLASYFGNLESLEDPRDPSPIYFNVLRLGIVRYPEALVVPLAALVAVAFAAALFVGFRRRVLTPSRSILGIIVYLMGLAAAIGAVLGIWALLSGTDSYQVAYNRHAPNELLLLALFAAITVALTVTVQTAASRIWKISDPDLTAGALAVVVVGAIVFAVGMPETSFMVIWPALLAVLAAGYWFLSQDAGSESLSVGQLVGFGIVAVGAVALTLPTFMSAFMASEANDWTLPIALLGILLGILVPQLRAIVKPQRWLTTAAAWIPGITLLVIAFIA